MCSVRFDATTGGGGYFDVTEDEMTATRNNNKATSQLSIRAGSLLNRYDSLNRRGVGGEGWGGGREGEQNLIGRKRKTYGANDFLTMKRFLSILLRVYGGKRTVDTRALAGAGRRWA